MSKKLIKICSLVIVLLFSINITKSLEKVYAEDAVYYKAYYYDYEESGNGPVVKSRNYGARNLPLYSDLFTLPVGTKFVAWHKDSYDGESFAENQYVNFDQEYNFYAELADLNSEEYYTVDASGAKTYSYSVDAHLCETEGVDISCALRIAYDNDACLNLKIGDIELNFSEQAVMVYAANGSFVLRTSFEVAEKDSQNYDYLFSIYLPQLESILLEEIEIDIHTSKNYSNKILEVVDTENVDDSVFNATYSDSTIHLTTNHISTYGIRFKNNKIVETVKISLIILVPIVFIGGLFCLYWFIFRKKFKNGISFKRGRKGKDNFLNIKF